MMGRWECPVTVVSRTETGRDEYNCPVYEEREEAVMALVLPKAASDLQAAREEGTKNSVTAYFPDSFEGSLKGCTLVIGGHGYRVVGDPRPYPACPTGYNRVVEAVDVDG